jgi:hypothetical protein
LCLGTVACGHERESNAKPRVMLEDYGYKLYPAGGFDYVLRRTDID